MKQYTDINKYLNNSIDKILNDDINVIYNPYKTDELID